VQVAGIDGTRGGWVAIVLDNGGFAEDHLIRPVEARFDQLVDAEVLAIDVPIGFGPRQADIAARRFLTGAASTVFTTPTRELLEMPFGPGLGSRRKPTRWALASST
jgi:predicted RNase H-like nuclease